MQEAEPTQSTSTNCDNRIQGGVNILTSTHDQ